MAEPVALPIRTTMDDVLAICAYLATKPIGATSAEVRSIIDAAAMDGRKVSAYRYWRLIEEDNERSKLSDRGRRLVKDKGVNSHKAMLEIVKAVPAYAAIVERAIHKKELVFSAVEVAAHWHEHFRQVASQHEKTLNDQAVCFFQVAAGAKLGTLVVGRKGSPTRFEFTKEGLDAFSSSDGAVLPRDVEDVLEEEHVEGEDDIGSLEPAFSRMFPAKPEQAFNNKVFITHGKNKKVLEQIKVIVDYGSFQPIVAQERESNAKPVPDKVMDDMRACSAAVIHVSAEGTFIDAKGETKQRINENVLIEIGAAMALYKRDFILVVEEGLQLPSNLQGLYECRYTGDELNTDATMKLLKALKAFRTD